MWRTLGSALAATLVLVALASPDANAQTDQPPVRVEVAVEGRELRIDLLDVAEPIGAIEIELGGLPPLGSACEVQSGFGACSEIEGVLRVVALNPTGWSDDSTLLVADLSRTPRDEITVEIPVLIDVDGADLPFVAVEPETAGDDGGGWLVPAMIAVGAVGLGAGVALVVRRRSGLAPGGPTQA